jgi:molybdopterin molybdotransferase
METMISLERALDIVTTQIKTVGSERVRLVEAYQRVLAEDVYSPMAMPPFDRSPLDGFTYRAGDLDPVPLTLNVVSEIPAGTWSERELSVGECARIFTGAPIPPGANCVVRQEDTEQAGEVVMIHKPVLPGSNVVKKAEEIEIGEVVLRKGDFLSPAAIGVLAALGIEEVLVYRRPIVGILSTGSELMNVGEPLPPGKIYNSNTYTLQGILQEAGCDVKVASFVADDLEETIQALKLFEETDIVVTTGGASVGEYDLIRDAMIGFGCELLFWKVNLKPGTPAAVGLKEDKLFFALSGNPAAAMITFELLVRPALNKLKGLINQEQFFPVRMVSGFGKSGKQRRFLRARAVLKNGEIWADPNYAQGSGVLRSMIGSNLLVEVPAGHGPVQPGETLQARWIISREEN